MVRLDALPYDQRHALVLHHVVGLSVPEVAAQLEVPLETIRSRLRLAQNKLREQAAGDSGPSKVKS
jgi:RNA polymerase sigma-70 factor (ECF subfamily)